MVKILLERGTRETCRYNALFYAFGNPEMVHYLVNEHGYSYEEIVPPLNRPVYEYAVRCSYRGSSFAGDRQTVEIFLKAGVDPNKIASLAIDKDCSDILKLASDYNADPEWIVKEQERKWGPLQQ